MRTTSATSERGPVYYGWVVVGAIATILMATAGARFLYGVVLKPVTVQFGWERAALTGAVTLNTVMLSVMQPLIGMFADRVGPKLVLIGGTALIALVLIPLSMVNALWQVYLLYGVIGAIGFAATSPVNITTLVNRWFDRRRGTALSIATAGTALGQLVVVPAATWTLTMTDWQTTYRVLAGVLLLVMVPLGFFLLRDQPARHGDLATTARPGTREAVLNADGETTSDTLAVALRTPVFWLLAWGFVACGFTMAFANTHFMAYADDMEMHAMTAANVVSVTAIFSVLGAVVLGLVADRRRRPPVLALTYALRGIAFLILFAIPDGPLVFLYALVLGVSWTATTPLTAAIAADRFGRKHFGVIFGTMFTAMHLGFGIGALLDGLIYDAFGAYRVALVINGIIGLSAAAAIYFIGDAKPGLARPRAEAPGGLGVPSTLAGD